MCVEISLPGAASHDLCQLLVFAVTKVAPFAKRALKTAERFMLAMEFFIAFSIVQTCGLVRRFEFQSAPFCCGIMVAVGTYIPVRLISVCITCRECVMH